MSENKNAYAKDLYRWKRGMDDYDIKILSALNKIIDGLTVLQCNEWEDIVDTMGSSTRTIAEYCGKIYNSGELMELAEKFEAVRTALFGDKIDYIKLLEVLRDNADECGWTEEKARQKREEKLGELEERRRETKAKYEGRFSAEMPERLKEQRKDFKEEKFLGGER